MRDTLIYEYKDKNIADTSILYPFNRIINSIRLCLRHFARYRLYFHKEGKKIVVDACSEILLTEYDRAVAHMKLSQL